MQKKIITFVFLIVYFQLNHLWAAENPTLEFGIFKMAPFYNVKNGKSQGGICTDIMEKILKKADLPYEIKIYPAPRLYSNLSTGKTDLFIGIKEAYVYKNDVIFSERPVSKAVLSVYTLGQEQIHKKEDFAGKSVIIVRGYAYGGLIKFLKDPKNNIRLETTAAHTHALKMLKAKRADYLLDYKLTIDETLEKNPVPGIKSSIISQIPLYLIVSKATKNAPHIMDKLTKAWKEIQKNK